MDTNPGPGPQKITADEYRSLLTEVQKRSPTLQELAAMEIFDPSIFWRLGCGDHRNLLDAALGEIERLTKIIDAGLTDGDTK